MTLINLEIAVDITDLVEINLKQVFVDYALRLEFKSVHLINQLCLLILLGDLQNPIIDFVTLIVLKIQFYFLKFKSNKFI